MHLAVRYLARWDRTVAQMEQFLRDKGASPTQVTHTIGRLSDLRYLNDRAYAERWVDSRLARQPMGRERLKVELQAKGVPDPVIDEALSDALKHLDEDALARRALTARLRAGRRRMTSLQAARLLRQWGFDEDVVARIMEARYKSE
jgi:regulatory protein